MRPSRIAAVAAVAFAAAGGGSPPKPGPASASSFRIVTNPVLPLAYGQSVTLAVESGGGAVPASSLSWTTSSTAIARVDAADHKPSWLDASASRYTGPFALEGYRLKFGETRPYIEPRDGHWFGFIGEVMTSPPSGALSPSSVGALMDIGYPAAWYGADR